MFSSIDSQSETRTRSKETEKPGPKKERECTGLQRESDFDASKPAPG